MNPLKIMAPMLLLCACAMTPESSEDREFEHALVSAEILVMREICKQRGGRVEIQRRGGVTRAQAANNVVGRWDTWSCNNDH